MNRRSIVLEVASQGGGTYTLMRVSEDASYREGAGARLVLTLREIDGRRAARIGAAIGAGLGALCAGGLAVALLPEHGAPDGLTPTRGDFWPEALAIGGVLGGLICGFVARMIGEPVRRALSRRGTIPPPSRMTAVFGEHVVVDGVDTGRLRKIESHPASSIVLVVSERATVRLTLAHERDALALAARLESIEPEPRIEADRPTNP